MRCGIENCPNEASETLALRLLGEVVGHPALATEMTIRVRVCGPHHAGAAAGTLGGVSIDQADLDGDLCIVRRPAS